MPELGQIWQDYDLGVLEEGIQKSNYESARKEFYEEINDTLSDTDEKYMKEL